jgi:hypothetical protein
LLSSTWFWHSSCGFSSSNCLSWASSAPMSLKLMASIFPAYCT